MKHIFMITLILAFFGLKANADQKMNSYNFDDELIKDDWIGVEKIKLSLDQTGIDTCKFLSDKNTKYSSTSFVVRRILLIAQATHCPERSRLVSTHLNSSDVLIRAAAIRLAGTLNKTERADFSKKIEKMQKTEKDPAIQEAVSIFFSN